jgi:hypothetical protein
VPTYARTKAGHKAKAIGQQFENMIMLWAARSDISCVRLPDGCKPFRGPKGISLKRVTTPFDFALFRSGRGIVMDAKTVMGHTFPYSAVTYHQIVSLVSCAHAHRAGYLVWYRELDTVAFHPAAQLQLLRPTQSLVPGQGLIIGNEYKIDLDRLFDDQALTSSLILPTK